MSTLRNTVKKMIKDLGKTEEKTWDVIVCPHNQVDSIPDRPYLDYLIVIETYGSK